MLSPSRPRAESCSLLGVTKPWSLVVSRPSRVQVIPVYRMYLPESLLPGLSDERFGLFVVVGVVLVLRHDSVLRLSGWQWSICC